jgi:hypothetical protein
MVAERIVWKGRLMHIGLGAIDGYPAEISGWWWLPGRNNYKVRAALTLDESGNADLDSKPDRAPVGWFQEPSESFPDHTAINIDVVHGRAGLYERPVSLIGCQVSGSNAGDSTLTASCHVAVDGSSHRLITWKRTRTSRTRSTSSSQR